MSEYDDVIGGLSRASDLTDAPPTKAPAKETAHPLVSVEQLERGSPKPFKGAADPNYPELDCQEPLYIPRFLVRRWGAEKFLRSSYYALWSAEAARPVRLFASDAKSERKR